jgi:hypothetical protein
MSAHNSIQSWDSEKPAVAPEEVTPKTDVCQQPLSLPIPGPEETAPCSPEAREKEGDEDDTKSAWSWASTSGEVSCSRSSCDADEARPHPSGESRSWGVNLMTEEADLLAELDADIASAVAAAERACCKDDAGLVFDYGATAYMLGPDEENERRPRSTSLGMHLAPKVPHRNREATLAYFREQVNTDKKSPPRYQILCPLSLSPTYHSFYVQQETFLLPLLLLQRRCSAKNDLFPSKCVCMLRITMMEDIVFAALT